MAKKTKETADLDNKIDKLVNDGEEIDRDEARNNKFQQDITLFAY